MKYLCEFILNDIKNQGQSMQTVQSDAIFNQNFV